MTTTAAPPFATEAMMPRAFRVVGRRPETHDTVTLQFEPEDGEPLTYAPGQFTMLYAFGVGEVPISIAGGRPGEPLMHTVRAVGAVTDAICDLSEGGLVGVRGPYGQGWPLERAVGKDLVIAAGGIGLAPLRSVVVHALDNRDHFGSVSLVYGTRSPSDLLYEEELRYWRSRFSIEVEVTVDRSDADWYGDVGVVTNLLPRITFDPANVVAMVCGPEIMMKVVARELGVQGVDPKDVYVSLERNMKCGIGLCGHCQFGPEFVCRDGPVVPFDRVMDRMTVEEL
ncbi:MAG: FAD/NAD(P)-binding protein [Acidimicrobiia bacterium]|nr:FAD/NAD(P)-binding protein [Acidimicrobiia bacterium]